MLPTAPTFRLFLFAFCLLIFDLCCAHPAPYSHTSIVFPRQDSNLKSPVTVTTTDKITTGAGTFTHTCKITLTPIVVNGVDMVRQEKTCTITPDNGNSGVPSALPPGSSPPVSAPSPSSTSPTLTSTSDTLSPTPTVTGLPPAGSGSVPPPVVSTSLTSVPPPSSSSSVSSSSSSTSTSSVSVPSAGGPVGVIGISTEPRPTTTATPSSENAGASTPVDLPGKKLEVLPIGLGVFAGVSVIALIVVGIVTYERTKHRRNFRKLRLQEAGSRMGYGAA